MPIPQDDPLLCGLSWATKVCASGIVHTGRKPERTFRESCNWMAASDDVVRSAIHDRNPMGMMALNPEFDWDDTTQCLTTRLDGRTAYARNFPDQGVCVLDSPDGSPEFEPVSVPRQTYSGVKTPLDVAGVIAEPGQTGADIERLKTAEEIVFENPVQMTNAFLVLHKGRLIIERYQDPFDENTQFESWSMGKTVAAMLAGVAVQQGHFSLESSASFDAWQNDDRQTIKLKNLLNMASGLHFTGSYGRTEDTSRKQENGVLHDHIYVYAGGVNSAEFCLSKPLADTPGTSGRYRNCDPLLTLAMIREAACGGSVQRFLTWPYENLLNRIGATGMILETDPYGHFLISGHDYGRTRDWARLGQLLLQRGAWGDEQIMPEHFVNFMMTPAYDAWDSNARQPYGGFAYLNAEKILPHVPEDALIMSGGGRQRVVVVPSLDLVMVRLGHINGQIAGVAGTLDKAYGEICAAVSSA
ncbi:MAG: serine hydrolase [Pseudomonadota bacterium]